MTHAEFWEKIDELKTCKSRDLYFDRLANLCFKRIASLKIDIIKSEEEIENLQKQAGLREIEITELRVRLSGKTNHCEACDGMGQEIAKLRKQVSDQSKIIIPLFTLSCKNCPPPYRDSEIIPDCPEHEPSCIECWLEWMAKQ